jgi:transposase
MANAKNVIVKETVEELKKLLRQQPLHLKNRVQMLLLLKKSDFPLNKIELSKALNVNHNTAQKWRKVYFEKGIEALLSDGRVGFKPSVISKELHSAIEQRLNSPKDAFTSYVDLIEWVVEKYMPQGVKYQTINGYIKRHFGAKLKVSRKSHANKDEKAVQAFKKTST